MRASFLLFACLAAGLPAQDIILQPAAEGNFRFKDIGGQAFAPSYIASFSYAASSVVVSLDTPGLEYLAGSLTASGLKPNFAYQVKLVGRSSSNASTPEELAAADDWTHQTLGRIGRWWRLRPNAGNSNDADYDANQANGAYAYEGYLVIAFFVTDAQGNATLRFEGSNSFHVLWRVDQRAPTPIDGLPLPVALAGTAGHPAYDAVLPPRNFALYGETEPRRALPGTLQMPAGVYRCNLVLTEESFHDSGALAGNWTTAFRAPVAFYMPSDSVVPPGPGDSSALPLEIERARLALNFENARRERGWVAGTLLLPPALAAAGALEGLPVRTELLGVVREFTLGADGRDVLIGRQGGSFELDARTDSEGRARFRLRVYGTPFDYSGPPADSVTFPVSLRLGTEEFAGSARGSARMGKHQGRIRFTR